MMTRSRYREQFDRDRSRVLLAGRSVSTNNPLKTPLTSEEEAEVLESLIISRRSGLFGKEAAVAKGYPSTVDAQGATVDASSPSGPLCVVCQFQARSIIAWPCRCLCVCEDCRVSLALNNFDKCVTCRREVSGFVRLWVP